MSRCRWCRRYFDVDLNVMKDVSTMWQVFYCSRVCQKADAADYDRNITMIADAISKVCDKMNQETALRLGLPMR